MLQIRHLLTVFTVICIPYRILSLPTIDASQIAIGMAQPISTQCASNTTYFTSVQVSPTVTTIKSFGISLIGYDTFVSTVIFIESKITKANSTHITLQATCINDLLWNKLQFSYIVVGTAVSYLDLYSQCILCPSLNTIDGERIYNFSLQPHTVPYTSQMIVSSSISSLNVSNTDQNGVDLQTKTYMKVSDNMIYHTIKAHTDTVLTSICITTIIYDLSLTSSQNYRILVATENKHLDSTIDAFLLFPDHTFFINSNSMYYGISSLNIYFQSATSQTVLFDITSAINFFNNFQGNTNINDIGYNAFFIIKLNCLPGQVFDPLSFSCEAACPAQTGPDPLSSFCEQCHVTCDTCAGSGIDKCKTCNNPMIDKFRQLKAPSPSECQCKPGYFEPSDGTVICNKCSDFIQNCDQCPDSLSCSQCLAGFTYNPITNRCGCTDTTKYFTNGICLPFPGCSTLSLTVPSQCVACDTALNFDQIQSNSSCDCKSGYQFDPPTISCKQICGDGRVLDDQCDDGNTNDKDGCSPNCKVQSGWMCSSISLQPTLCMLEIIFELSYEYCTRDITSNSATFTFTLTPPLTSFTTIDLTNSLKFSFPYKIKSYTYNQQDGQLSITTSFSQSLQSTTQTFQFNFQKAKVWTDPLSVEFQVSGVNAQIVVDQYAESYRYVLYGAVMICGISWMLAIVVALVGYRNLCLQLMLPIQAIYFVLVSQQPFATSLRALQFLKFINGYNSLTGFTPKEIVSNGDRGYTYAQYTSNLNYFILANVGCVVMLFIVKGVHFAVNRKLIADNKLLSKPIVKQNLEQQDNKKVEKKQQLAPAKQQQPTLQQLQPPPSPQPSPLTAFHLITSKLLLFIGQRFCITLLLLTLQSTLFYLGMFIIYVNEYKLFSLFINNMACLVAVILSFVGLAVYPQQKYKEIYIVFENKLRYSYTKLFALWYAIFIVVLIAVCSFDVKGLILMAIMLPVLIIVLLLVKNPYKTRRASCLRFILPLVQQCVLTAPCVMLWVVGFFNHANTFLYLICTLMVLGSCLLAIFLTMIRLYFEHKFFKANKDKLEYENTKEQKEDKEKEKEDGQQTKDKTKDFDAQIRENLLNKSKNFEDRDDYSTTKNQDSKKPQNELTKKETQSEEEYQSRNSQHQKNIEDIKNKLKKQLRQKRNVLRR